MKHLTAYDPGAIARQRLVRNRCACESPADARAIADRTARIVVERRSARHRTKDDAHARALAHDGIDPIIIAAADGSKCRPFLTVQHDQERFAACNAIADAIGPIDDPEDAFKLIGEMIGNEPNEVFGLITLDIHNRYKGAYETGRGEVDAVMAPLKPTLRAALLDVADSIILMHCHPSGVPAEPSDADKETTEAFVEACEIVDITLLDHVITGMNGKKRDYFSFREAKLLPPLTSIEEDE